MIERPRTTMYRYGVALLALIVAAAARIALDPVLGNNQPVATFFLALAMVATSYGFGPSMVVLAGSLVLYPFLFRQPRPIALPNEPGVTLVVIYTFLAIAVASMCSALRSARARAEAGQESLRNEMIRRSQAEAELRQSETRWKALIENSSDAITMIAADGTLRYISPSVTKITGFTPEELVGQVGFGYVHPDDRAIADRALAEVIARPRDSISTQFRLLHKNGSWLRVENVATNRLADPAIGAIVINTRDVTERITIQQRLVQFESRFRVFMDNSPALSYLKDQSGRYVWGNRAWAERVGRPLDDLVGLDDFQIWPESVAKSFRESDRKALESGRAIEIMESAGDRTYMSVKFPIEHEGKRFLGGKAFDVTDRVRAEEMLRRSEAMFMALADSMPQIVWAAGPDGSVDYFNKRWFDYTGLSAEQTYSAEGWAAILHPDDHDRSLETWNAAVQSGKLYQIEYRFRDRAHGGYRWHLGRALPVRDASGKIVRWYGTCTDIDDQKRAESAAEAANEAKNRFLAVLSHELRTPLTPVLLSVSALLENPRSDLGEARPVLDLIRRNVALEARLIDDLLDVMRIVQGKFSLNVESCDLHDLIARASEICRGDVEAAGATITLDLDATDTSIVADPARVQQVFWNLIKNAAKFSPKGGTIAIRTRDDRASGQIVIEVSDIGVGIAPEFLPKVFEAFEQGEASSWTRKYGGLGLGLAISRAIVQAHGGEIEARSDGPGRGATFRVALPTASSGESAAAALSMHGNAKAAPATSRDPLRILLVEDDPTTLTILSRLLKLDRHAVTTANSAAAALNAVEVADDCFDLIISDIGLPDGDGVELMRRLQLRKKFPSIALSGFGMEEDVRKSLDAGFSAHLVKPIDYKNLETTIQKVLQAT